MKQTIYLTSDHGGFELKNKILQHLQAGGRDVVDLGPDVLDPTDDYPDYILTLVRHMRHDDYGVGIVVDRNGQGMCMAANRNPAIRAVTAGRVDQAKHSRRHNNANVLCLANDFTDEAANLAMVDAWLNEPFENTEARHSRRLRKIEQYFPL